jgi:apolipoprotein D and lipocalin family protein
VTFFWPFFADYWIIDLDLDKDYRYAVVGEPDRKYLWIISRTPQLDDVTYRQILERISEGDTIWGGSPRPRKYQHH